MIVGRIAQELAASGFDQRKGATLWRRTSCKFEILKFDVVSKARCNQWGEPLGSFLLETSCLFPFLPQIEAGDEDKALRPEKGFGQLRLSLRRGLRQPDVKANNIWWAGEDAATAEAVSKDVSGIIRGTALPFFNRFDAPEELLRTFIEDEMSMEHGGVWSFGRKGSPVRLLYTGFAALECGKWDLAASSLNACRAKTVEIGKNDIGENIRAKYQPWIDLGLACAAEKRGWSVDTPAAK